MTQSEAIIAQVNLSYHQHEDRLLLKLGLSDNTEVSIWITRRVCQSIWILLHQKTPPTELVQHKAVDTTISVKPSAKKSAPSKAEAIKMFSDEVAEQKIVENMDFNAHYDENRTPLTQEPLLAIECALVYVNDQPSEIDLQCKDGQSAKIRLNKELIHALIGTIKIATTNASWNMVSNNDLLAVGASAQGLLH